MSSRFLKISLIFLGLFLFIALPKESFAFFSRSERKIIVFRQDVSAPAQDELLTRFKITSYKNLRLINARAARLSSRELSLLNRDPRVLRIDPDVEVYALPRRDWCDRYPWLPWCPQPTPTPTPTPTPSPTPSPSPSPTPSPSLTPTPTPSPSPSPTPSSSPTPTPTPSPTPTPTSTPSPSPSPTPTPSPTPSPTPTPTPTTQPAPWGVARIDADDAWPISTGSGVKVAVLDTGIDIDHPDLDDNLAGCVNFIYWWRNCNDDNGHGTHVSGIIAAENNDFGVVGVAPEAKIYSLKVLNSRGSGYLSDIIEALDWTIANNMNVVNMSLGASSDVQSFHDAVQRVYTAGITLVAAAGNSGPGADTVLYPARYPEVIAVSATNSSDNVPSWSSRGPEIDLAAPGVSVYSTYRGGGYQTMSGTSMAAPHVTGTVALRLEDHPGENPSLIETILETTAVSLPFDPTLVGAGLVNAYNVVAY